MPRSAVVARTSSSNSGPTGVRRLPAAFNADTTGGRKHEHPVWNRFVELAGDSRISRTLFAEMIENPDNFARLDDAVGDPKRAAVQYTEVVRAISAQRDQLMRHTFHVKVWPGESPAEFATILYLGACFSGDPKSPGPDKGVSYLPTWGASKPLRGPSGGPIGKLFVAWLDRREDAGLLSSGLEIVFCHALADGLPIARRIAADAKLPATTRAAALPVLGRLGSVKDLPTCMALLNDEYSVRQLQYRRLRAWHADPEADDASARRSCGRRPCPPRRRPACPRVHRGRRSGVA